MPRFTAGCRTVSGLFSIFRSRLAGNFILKLMNAYTAIIVMVAYFGVLLLVSRFTSKSSDNNAFFRGNHQSPWWLVAFGMIGSSISGASFVSVPGMVRDVNMSYLQMCIGFVPGYMLVAFVLLPIYYKLRLTSIYDYLNRRFGAASHKTGASFFIISKMTGAAARLYLVCLVLQRFVFDQLGVPYEATVVVTLLLTWMYTRKSGVRTLVWTDALQTLALIVALFAVIFIVAGQMNLDARGVADFVSQSPHGRIFVFDDWKSGQFFWKEFFAGMFIVVVMTGLDQDMMQKNLSCKNLRDAQKDMTCCGFAFLPMNLLFLSLGVLLYGFCAQQGIVLPERTDDLLPSLAVGGYLGAFVPVLFIIGIVAAAFSSADSALTALTTSFCIDIIGIERKGYSKERAVKTRRYVHVGVTVAFVLFIVGFKALNSTSVIDAIYTMASYTYGPLLGMFVFGLFTKKKPVDRYVPYLAIASPVVCYVINVLLVRLADYHFGYELLLINGLFTFVGLLLLSFKKRATV